MRHHTARQLAGTGGWHYVDVGRNGGRPLGYCATHPPHPTEGEARECYNRWRRDHVRLDGGPTRWVSCRVCKCPADRYAHIDGDPYSLASLCAEHLTTEHATAAMHLDEPAGDAWVS